MTQASQVLNEDQNEHNLYSNFIDSLRSKSTKLNYDYALKRYMQFHRLEKYSSMMVQEKEQMIKEYIVHLVNNNASTAWINMIFSALHNFYEMNDVEDIKWKKLKRFMGEEIPHNEDRCYTHEEIHTLVSSAKMKMKAAILLMASSGIRKGSLSSMLVSHLDRKGNLYKISVYEGLSGKGKYFTFCTPEAAEAIDNYLDFRTRCGEKLNENSPLFRRDFDSNFIEQARKDVHPWTYDAIHRALHELLVSTGLIVVDHTRYKRNKVKMAHGFRSFFETQLVNAKIHDIIIKKLTGHAPGRNMTQLYSKQTEEELFSEYQKAIPLLTINPENRLKTELKITQKKQDEIAEIKSNYDMLIKTLIKTGVLKPSKKD